MDKPGTARRTDSMHVDLLDQAFLARLTSPADPCVRPPADPAVEAATVAAPATDVVGMLLAMAADEWAAVVDMVERAVGTHAGRFVVAVVARRPGDGCTTFTQALEQALRERGHDVAIATPGAVSPPAEPSGDRAPHGPDHPRGITLLDAGAWFGTGPIRRDRAETLAAACHAAILLRRADRASAAAFARAISVSGVRVLGEVATFSRGFADHAEAAPS